MGTDLLVGLGAALAWGIASYLGAIGARQFGGWITNTISALFAFLALVPLVVVAWQSRLADPTLGDLALLSAIGLGILIIDFVLYQLLVIAPVALIYPILASNGAVVAVLAVLLLGEELTGAQLMGVVLVTIGIAAIAWRRPSGEQVAGGLAEEALSGAALMSGPRRSAAPPPRQASLSVIAAAVAVTVVAGVVLFIYADYTKRLGWYIPILVDRGSQTILIVALLAIGLPARAHYRGHAPRWWLLLVVMGMLNALASSLYGLGNQVGSTAVTATAASTFAAVPVVLGIVLLGERPQRHQAAGIAAAIVGIVLLGA